MTAPLLHCARILQPGRLCHVGQLDDGSYGIWLVAGGAPVAIYSPDHDGWQAVWNHFMAWEHTPGMPPPRDHAGAIALAVVVTIVVIAYIAYHAYRYHGCVVGPGIFSWPSRCI